MKGYDAKRRREAEIHPTLKYFIAFNKVNKDNAKVHMYMNGIFSFLFSWMRRHL